MKQEHVTKKGNKVSLKVINLKQHNISPLVLSSMSNNIGDSISLSTALNLLTIVQSIATVIVMRVKLHRQMKPGV